MWFSARNSVCLVFLIISAAVARQVVSNEVENSIRKGYILSWINTFVDYFYYPTQQVHVFLIKASIAITVKQNEHAL